LIKRSQRDGDPWSGHLALPGGRPDESDLNHYQTAVRETFEEVAIDLGGCHYLGELPAVAPRMRQQVGPLIFPHLFWTDQTFEFSPNPQEVDSVFHLSVHQLFDSQNFEQKFFQMNNGETINLPSMRLPQGILWGLTYVIIIQLMEQILGTSIGHSYWQENELPKWWRRP
jgi:8-oxo-dGTP pyrophosphatase MutT (NUDIX family)